MIFTKKSIVLKIIIATIIVILTNFIVPNYANASTSGIKIGGVLTGPILDFVVTIADSVLSVAQKSLIASGTVTVPYNTNEIDAEQIGNGGITALTGLIVGGAAIATIASGGLTLGLLALAAGGGYYTYNGASKVFEGFKGTLLIPTIQISPQEIFSNVIPAFDVNFINPNPNKDVKLSTTIGKANVVANKDEIINAFDKVIEINKKYNNIKGVEVLEKFKGYAQEDSSKYADNVLQELDQRDYFAPIYSKLSEEEQEAFENFPPKATYKQKDVTTETTTTIYSTAGLLKNTVAAWYNTLRNIALVFLLSILVYIGIRMMLTSIASDKAKYKKMIIDWLIAICMLFLLHYIMAFTLELTEKINEVLISNNQYIEIPISTNMGTASSEMQGVEKVQTNLIGYARFMMQSPQTTRAITFIIIYVVLVIYTIMFIFIYAKRVIYMGFLTVIAPLICITYPIDKINDGKSQAFDMWLKEYIFNALIQPFHLLIYTIFVGTAMEMATENIVIALTIIGFMVPAEKFLRKMFGFEKAGTVGALSGMAGGALLMSGLKMLGKPIKQKEKEELSRGDTEKLSPFGTLRSGLNGAGGSTSTGGPAPTGGPTSAGGPAPTGGPTSAGGPTPSPFSSSRSSANKFSGFTKIGKGGKIAKQKGTFGAIGGIGKRALRNTFNKKNAGKALRFTGKTAARIAAGGILGGVGLAAGITTGDFSNAVKYAATGAMTGSKLGGNAASKTGEMYDDTKEEFLREMYGSNYKKYNARKYNEEFRNNPKNMRKLREEFGSQAEEIMQSKEMEEFLDNNITDIGKISKALKFYTRGELSTSEAVAIAKLEKQTSKDIYSDANMRKEFKQMLIENGFDAKAAEDTIDYMEQLQ